MNILFLDWGAFGKEPCIRALEGMGHKICRFIHADYQERLSVEFDAAFDEFVDRERADICFSFNFYPIVAEACHRNGIKYISVVYDSPLINVFSYKVLHPTNYVFLFDSAMYERLKNGGINTVHYMPLASEVFTPDPNADKRLTQKIADVSFVGSLYNEDHNLYERMEEKLDDYTRGYLEAVMEAQLRVYGYNFTEEMLTRDILDKMVEACAYSAAPDGAQTLEYVYANYFLGRKMTQIERRRLLTALASRFDVSLFTLNKDAVIPRATNYGAVDYYTEMPYVFRGSRINMNITLRSIYNGIPLRAMDIMAAGGFLMTNFQADFLRHFKPGEEFVYYESQDDLMAKTEYYLSHESERADIAAAGQEAIRKNHSFEVRMREIFELVTGSGEE
ncbi:MAG: glycosyltransferase [Eubacterium sp.]|nr:glycosyltransferase [Eubacterium sp.]